MGRDGLFVDICLSSTPATQPPTRKSKDKNQVIRLCNTHLDSLAITPPLRPTQLSTATAYLSHPHIPAGLIAGDTNAISPFDRTLHSANGLVDAYLALGGEEDSEEGYTWGYQSEPGMRERFGCSRMDKILCRGGVGVRGLRRVGVGVRVVEGRGSGLRIIMGLWVILSWRDGSLRLR
jgi:tyrosyl-DNA phosphodiesterase 2